MADKTYYSLLEIQETASAAEIRIAYRRLMMDVHPDRLANAPAYWQRQAEERSKEINQAFAVLSRPELRRLYDAQLSAERSRHAERIRSNPTSYAPPASQPYTPTSTANSSTVNGAPARSFNPELTLPQRLFFVAILALFGIGAMLEYWESTSFAEELFLFIVASSALFTISLMFRRQVSRLLTRWRMRTAWQRRLSIMGSLLICLFGGKVLHISQSSHALRVDRPYVESPSVNLPAPVQPASETVPSTRERSQWVISASLPNGTEIVKRRRTAGYGKLTVDNGTAYDAVLELVDGKTQKAIRVFYVTSGEKFTEDRVGPGTYSVYYMTGTDWNSTAKVFNQVVESGVFDQTATFAEERNDQTGEVDFHEFSITLQPVVGGNARTSTLDAEEFKRAMVSLNTQ